MTRRQRLLVILLTVAVAYGALALIDGAVVTKDTAPNVRMAVNLAHQGTLWLVPVAPCPPSMYREPLPILVGSALVVAIDRAPGAAPAADYAPVNNLYTGLPGTAWLMLARLSLMIARSEQTSGNSSSPASLSACWCSPRRRSRTFSRQSRWR